MDLSRRRLFGLIAVAPIAAPLAAKAALSSPVAPSGYHYGGIVARAVRELTLTYEHIGPGALGEQMIVAVRCGAHRAVNAVPRRDAGSRPPATAIDSSPLASGAL